MSTLKVSAIQSPSTTDGGLAISATGAVSGGLPVPNRNLIYNGAMQVAQRGTSTTGITSGGFYTADRWYINRSAFGTWTQTVESDGPAGSGLTKSIKMLCTTAEASPIVGANLQFWQKLEGQDVQRIAKGTASAQQLTLSFWVKSNVTGTYVAELFDSDNTRSVSAAYTVESSATWEFKTVTFPVDTTGVLDNDNADSLSLRFWLGAGTSYTSGTLATAWESVTSANRAVGQTNLAAAVNNYWQITGVQLETGPVATEFEHRSFGDELARCQRYYQKSYNYSDAPGSVTSAGVVQGGISTDSGQEAIYALRFAQSMRTAPTVTGYDTDGTQGSGSYFRSGASGQANISTAFVGENGCRLQLDNIGAAWVVALVRMHYTADAEL